MQKFEGESLHKPVLLRETLRILEPRSGEIFLDATLGLGGHAEAILNNSESVSLIAVDQDLEAISHAKSRLQRFGGRVQIIHANFSDIRKVLAEADIDLVDGIFADLGVSSLQFDNADRGFSFRFDAPLDMRMNTESTNPTAAKILETFSEEEIANLIYQYGEERLSRRIAKKIVQRRETGDPVKTTKQLADLVERAVGRKPKDKIHPATRTFQALRITVNRELDLLAPFINDSIDLLKKNGRLALITFHSLEDRIVKQTFQRLAGKCICPPRIPQCICGAKKRIEILTKKPITPREAETSENLRARSAKLRACKKLA